MEQTKKLNMTAMSDKTNSNTTAKKEEPAWEHKVAMKVSGVSIAVNLLLSLFKLLAGILAHSGAMISDAIHSASDVGSTFVVIVGVNLSSKKSDKEHQYGHERMECVSSIILSGLLLATGIHLRSEKTGFKKVYSSDARYLEDLSLHGFLSFCITGMIYHLINGIPENVDRCLGDHNADHDTGDRVQDRVSQSCTEDADKRSDRGKCI